MKITVHIDANTLEGKQIIEYLKSFPEFVTFENESLNESRQEYLTKSTATPFSTGDYVTIEEFRVEAKKRAKVFLEKHGLHS